MKMHLLLLILFAMLFTACGDAPGDGATDQGQSLNPSIEFLDDNGDNKGLFVLTAAGCIQEYVDVLSSANTNAGKFMTASEIAAQCAWVCEFYEKFPVIGFVNWLKDLVRTEDLTPEEAFLIFRFTTNYCH